MNLKYGPGKIIQEFSFDTILLTWQIVKHCYNIYKKQVGIKLQISI